MTKRQSPSQSPLSEGQARDDNDKSADAIRHWLEQTGYGLEHVAADALDQAGFIVRQGLTYRDGIEGKVREVDVEGRAALAARKVEMHVAVECKKSRSPWVTRTTGLPLQKGSVQWQPIATKAVGKYFELNRPNLTGAFDLPSPTDFDVMQAFRDDPKSGDPAYRALSQVVSAATGLLASTEMLPNPALVHPVIILESALYRATFVDYPDTEVVRIPWARIHWSGSESLGRPVLVDIVTVEAVRGYLAELRVSLGKLADHLEHAPGDFRARGARVY